MDVNLSVYIPLFMSKLTYIPRYILYAYCILKSIYFVFLKLIALKFAYIDIFMITSYSLLFIYWFVYFYRKEGYKYGKINSIYHFILCICNIIRSFCEHISKDSVREFLEYTTRLPNS